VAEVAVELVEVVEMVDQVLVEMVLSDLQLILLV
jgi:hypothetical protein|tara:strand:- start:202 stop:303 length:102 start_codon:yes stop_codon:yes gene_type:complete